MVCIVRSLNTNNTWILGTALIPYSFTTSHFACVYFARKLILFQLNCWFSFQRRCRILGIIINTVINALQHDIAAIYLLVVILRKSGSKRRGRSMSTVTGWAGVPGQQRPPPSQLNFNDSSAHNSAGLFRIANCPTAEDARGRRPAPASESYCLSPTNTVAPCPSTDEQII